MFHLTLTITKIQGGFCKNHITRLNSDGSLIKHMDLSCLDPYDCCVWLYLYLYSLISCPSVTGVVCVVFFLDGITTRTSADGLTLLLLSDKTKVYIYTRCEFALFPFLSHAETMQKGQRKRHSDDGIILTTLETKQHT